MVLWPKRGKTYYAVIDYWEKYYVMRVRLLRAGIAWATVETDECGIREEETVERKRLYRHEQTARRACAILNAMPGRDAT